VGSSNKHLVAISANGEKLWSKTVGNRMNLSPSIFEDSVIVAEGLSKIQKFRTNNGSSEWSSSLKKTASSAVALTANAVYAGTANGSVVAVGQERGIELWRHAIPEAQHVRVAVAGGWLFATGDDGTVTALAD